MPSSLHPITSTRIYICVTDLQEDATVYASANHLPGVEGRGQGDAEAIADLLDRARKAKED